MGDLSPHFDSSEFRCRHCGVVKRPAPALVDALERLRAIAYPDGLRIVSGYRCPEHNARIGGASRSQHLYATAADIEPRVPLDRVKAMKGFSGIGWSWYGRGIRRRRLVRHVDVRHAGPFNPFAATKERPTTFRE